MKRGKNKISWSRLVVASVTAGLTLASPLGTGLIGEVFATAVSSASMCINMTHTECNDVQAYTYDSISDTYTLSDNIEFSAGKSIRITAGQGTTLDLSGKTVTGAIKVMGGTLTIKNGTVDDNSSFALSVFNGSQVTLEGVTAKADSGNNYDRGMYVDDEGTVVTIGEGTTITSDAYGVDVNNGSKLIVGDGEIKAENTEWDTYGVVAWNETEVTVNGGKISAVNGIGITGNGTSNSSSENYGGKAKFTVNGGEITGKTGIYAPQYDGVTTVNGGTITGSETGIEARAGTLKVTGGTITSTSETNPAESARNGSGTTTDGAAIAVAEHNTDDDTAVMISGGEIRGNASLYQANPNSRTVVPTMAVLDGTFVGEVYAEEVTEFLAGGNYSVAPVASYIADEYDAYKNSENTYDILAAQEDKTGEALKLTVGNSEELGESYADFSDYLTYESADTNIATVAEGTVTAVAPGETTVSAKLVGIKATYTASYATKVYAVIDDGDEDVELNVNGGQWYDGDLDADVRTNGEWTSGDEGVATVSAGVISPVAAGNTDVTVEYGSQRKTYHVTVKSVFSAVELADPTVEYEYTGEAQEAEIKVIGASGETVSADYYDVAYEDNINAGTATVTVTVNEAGIEAGYKAESTKSTTFTIKKASSTQTLSNLTVDYSGMAEELGTLTTDNDGTVEYSLDEENWSEEAPTATNLGQYTVYYRILGGENYEDVAATPYIATIVAGPFEIELVTNDDYDQKYNAAGVMGAEAARDAEWQVNDESVATVSGGTIYARSVGETVATATYHGVSVVFNVIVAKATSAEEIWEAEIFDTSNLPKYVDDGVDPEHGSWFSGDENVATAEGNTITAVGVGRTTVIYLFGNVVREYEVAVRESITTEDGEGELAFTYDYEDSLDYTGEEQIPELTLTAPDGTVLTKDENYWTEIRYYADQDDPDTYETLENGAKDVVNEGSYAIYVEGMGDYTGSIRMWFRINPVDLSNFTATALDAEYTGEAITPEITVMDGDGNVLEQGKDFTYLIDGTDQAETGVDDYRITISGVGNYVGTQVINWSIVEVPQIIENGAYTIRSAVNNNFVLDIANGSTADGANVQVYRSNDSLAQKFIIEYVGAGYYWIENVRSGKALGVPGLSAQDGTNVAQYDYYAMETLEDDNRILWKAEEVSDGVYTFRSALGDYYLNLSGGRADNSRNVQVYHSDNTNAMKWGLVKDEKYTGGMSEAIGYMGVFEFVSKLNNSSVLDVAGGSVENGANVWLYHSNGTDAQRFWAMRLDNGYYVLVNENTIRPETDRDSKVLDVAGGSNKNGANVQQYKWNGTPAQQWKITDNADGTVSLMSRASGKYLDVSGGKTADKTNVQIWDGNGTNSQKFTARRMGIE